MTLQRSASFNKKKLYSTENVLLCNVLLLVYVCIYLSSFVPGSMLKTGDRYMGE